MCANPGKRTIDGLLGARRPVAGGHAEVRAVQSNKAEYGNFAFGNFGHDFPRTWEWGAWKTGLRSGYRSGSRNLKKQATQLEVDEAQLFKPQNIIIIF